MNLNKSWEITRLHLEKARNLLPSSSKESSEGGNLAEFEDFLSHNELGLAFDELELIGLENPCPPEFWQEMLVAAGTMQLFEQAERCRAKLR
jgi:hypothetical protein